MKKILAFLMIFVLTSCGTTVNRLSSNSLAYLDIPENAKYIIIAGHEHNTENHNHKAMVLFKDFVETKSNGEIGVKIYPNGQLIANVNEGIEGLNSGAVDLFHITGSFASYWEPIAVFDLPYMLEDDRIAEAVFDNEEFISQFRQGILEKHPSIRLLGIANSSGWRNFVTTKKQIKSPDDIKGLKLRTIASKAQQELVSLLGGTPTTIPFSETYIALSTGVVDGTKNGILDVITVKLHESTKYMILDRHAYMAAYWFFNNKKYESMPYEFKNIINDAYNAMSWYLRSYPKYAEVEAYNIFRQNGGIIYQPSDIEIAMFREKTKGLRNWLINEYGSSIEPWLKLYEDTITEERTKLQRIRTSESQ
ncbi:MAG: TRAP transporter substrate-binding protein DctP [Brevinema sp.]